MKLYLIQPRFENEIPVRSITGKTDALGQEYAVSGSDLICTLRR
jgi:hypothetical protein